MDSETGSGSSTPRSFKILRGSKAGSSTVFGVLTLDSSAYSARDDPYPQKAL